MYFKVAEYDGTLTTGLKLDGDTDVDGEIDVTIGAGAESVTTIAGTLTMGSTATINSEGIIQTVQQNTITTLNGVTSLGASGATTNILSQQGLTPSSVSIVKSIYKQRSNIILEIR